MDVEGSVVFNGAMNLTYYNDRNTKVQMIDTLYTVEFVCMLQFKYHIELFAKPFLQPLDIIANNPSGVQTNYQQVL